MAGAVHRGRRPRADRFELRGYVDPIANYGMLHHMRARLLYRFKGSEDDVIVEMVLWRLPRFEDEGSRSSHGVKYRLYCGRAGQCVVRYDNEKGKGDHRHYGDTEEPYSFTSVAALVEDFAKDCERLAGWRWNP